MGSKPYRFGRASESLVADYLREQGYVILEQNYRVGRMEVDLIAMDRTTLVFVEVKARHASPQMYELQELITPDKIKRMVRVIDVYCRNTSHQFEDCRIDYTFVIATDSPHGCEVIHIPNAYIPTL